MIVLVTGARNWTDREAVWNALSDCALSGDGLSLVLVGDCPTGADRFAREWCEATTTPVRVYKADWQAHGRRAGPLRNHEMVLGLCRERALGNYCRGIAFPLPYPDGRGTRDCMHKLRHSGFYVDNRGLDN